jgi:putative nucleotidyltransferase-like protein
MLSEGTAAIPPLLLASGAGALGWWRLRHSDVERFPAVRSLRETYLRYAIWAAEHERKLVEVFRVLRSSEVEPILIKGWAIARAYPEAGLRPSGDIDLYVSPEQHAKARAVLNAARRQQYWVDLDHDEISRFSDFNFAELSGRSELVNLDGTEIRVMSAEDHLRILCLHLLKHGAWRPLWLCDVGAALESRLPNFDWDRCFGRNKRRADWIACTIGLANRLLGAELGDVPVKNRANSLPGWLISSVLKQWGAPYPPNLTSFATQLKAGWWKPDILSAIRQRWPSPIQATVDANGRFDNTTRLPFQLGNCIARTVKLCLHLRAVRP